jgi:hypothetical protein
MSLGYIVYMDFDINEGADPSAIAYGQSVHDNYFNEIRDDNPNAAIVSFETDIVTAGTLLRQSRDRGNNSLQYKFKSEYLTDYLGRE